MARSRKLQDIERERGDLHKIIPPLVNEKGQYGAASELNLTQATISIWLKHNGYHRIIRWEKVRAAHEQE